MDRREFLRCTAIAGAAGLFIDPREAAAYQPPGAPAVSPPASPLWPAPFDSAPVLQGPGAEEMTVTVAVNGLTTAWLEYGPTDKLGQRVDDSRHGLLCLSGRNHRFHLTGLKPALKYFYKVWVCPITFRGAYKITRGTPVGSAVYSFTTLDGGVGSRASFSVINDTHENGATIGAALAVVGGRNPGVMFWNGDLFNDVRDDNQIVAQVMRPAGSVYASGQPVCLVSGNHDVRGIHARSLERFLDGPQGQRHYLLRQGPVAFVVLDTGEDKVDTHPGYAGLCDFARYRATQKEWLAGAVKTELWRSAAFRVGVLHIPLWGKAASEDSRRQWHGLLNESGTDVVINGHVHEYLYSPPDSDHRYGQLVGGGPAPEIATVIHGQADRRSMALLVHDLSGKEIGNYEFKRG